MIWKQAGAVTLGLLLVLPLAAWAGDAPATTVKKEVTSGNPRVLMKTSMGDIVIELFPKEAPKTVENFLQYVRDGFYDGTIFHRVIPGFVIQGGGFTAEMQRKETRPPIVNEADNGLRNLRGTLSMARTREINSATSQFFINLVDNRALDHRDNTPAGFGYAVFGKVVKGMDVVDAIAKVETHTVGPYDNVPVEPVVIEKAVVLGEENLKK
jgi:cyclophilin family peptidyl-prolyl cis-trans isomerase